MLKPWYNLENRKILSCVMCNWCYIAILTRPFHRLEKKTNEMFACLLQFQFISKSFGIQILSKLNVYYFAIAHGPCTESSILLFLFYLHYLVNEVLHFALGLNITKCIIYYWISILNGMTKKNFINFVYSRWKRKNTFSMVWLSCYSLRCNKKKQKRK